MHPTPLQAFQDSLSGVRDPHGLARLASQLQGPDAEVARRRLLQLLADPGMDARLPEALAAVAPDHYETLDALETAAASWIPSMKLGSVRALAKITGVFNPEPARALLRKSPSAAVREQAVRTLAAHPAGREDALRTVTEDPDRDVRTAAFDSLLSITGLEPLERVAPNDLSMMGIRVRSPLKAVYTEAGTQFTAVVTGAMAGRSRVQLGLEVPPLTEATNQLRFHLLDPAQELQFDALKDVRGQSRRWLIDLCLGRLHHGDPRLPTALVALHATRAKPAVEEALKGADGAFAESLQAALAKL
ncbi:MAG: hypothetical protein AB8H79_14415 [Myxococcota bacterium]